MEQNHHFWWTKILPLGFCGQARAPTNGDISEYCRPSAGLMMCCLNASILNPNILQIHTDWPSPMRNKGVFFVKKEKKPMPAENFDFAEHMAVGDIYPNVLGFNYSVLFVISIEYATCKKFQTTFVPGLRKFLYPSSIIQITWRNSLPA